MNQKPEPRWRNRLRPQSRTKQTDADRVTSRVDDRVAGWVRQSSHWPGRRRQGWPRASAGDIGQGIRPGIGSGGTGRRRRLGVGCGSVRVTGAQGRRESGRSVG
jgi:hypothetical protein